MKVKNPDFDWSEHCCDDTHLCNTDDKIQRPTVNLSGEALKLYIPVNDLRHYDDRSYAHVSVGSLQHDHVTCWDLPLYIPALSVLA